MGTSTGNYKKKGKTTGRCGGFFHFVPIYLNFFCSCLFHKCEPGFSQCCQNRNLFSLFQLSQRRYKARFKLVRHASVNEERKEHGCGLIPTGRTLGILLSRLILIYSFNACVCLASVIQA